MAALVKKIKSTGIAGAAKLEEHVMKHKILIVDDEEEIISTIRRNLEFSMDVDILTANGCQSAISVLQSQTPSVVLTDISMPDGTGLDLLQKIKPHNHSIQFILMTGQSSLDRALDCLENGASDYLMKPLDMAMMEKIIKEAIERYERWLQVVKINLHNKRQSKAA